MKTRVHIALLMMVKNETKRLHVTLNSVKGFVDSLIIYDTGSTDNTIDILKTFSQENSIPLRLKCGEFENFSTSRNVSLEFAETFDDVDFLLLLDCNDELQNGNELRRFAKTEINTDHNGYLVMQEWYSGKYDQYYNIRFIKNHKGWRFNGVVHEWISIPSQHAPTTPKIPHVKLFQDRTQDDDKSSKRFLRDRVLLLEEFNKNPTEPRTVFYLAQTCACLNLLEEAYKYYVIRSNLDGFTEEKYHAYVRLGEICEKVIAIKMLPNNTENQNEFYTSITWTQTVMWYMKAIEHTTDRIEGYIPLINYYRSVNNWKLAYTFCKLACELEYPNRYILFNNSDGYQYQRWHLMGIVAFYVGKYKKGYDACQMAIKVRNQEIDKNNLKFYKEKLSVRKKSHFKQRGR
jgi:glycosyltransferase involved in cell wall biosynthesis